MMNDRIIDFSPASDGEAMVCATSAVVSAGKAG
jgi:hypothetical protein